MSQLDEEELEIVEDGLDVDLSSESMAMMFHNRNGLATDPKKLRNNHAKLTKSPVSTLTPAEQIISQLSSTKNVSVAHLVANVTLGEELVTPYTGRKKKKPDQNLIITFETNVTNNGIESRICTLDFFPNYGYVRGDGSRRPRHARSSRQKDLRLAQNQSRHTNSLISCMVY